MKTNPKMTFMKQNARKRMFEHERTKQKNEKTIPLKTEERSNLKLLVAKNSSAKILANFRRKRGSGDFFTVQALYL
jgi:hypothetical protein